MIASVDPTQDLDKDPKQREPQTVISTAGPAWTRNSQRGLQTMISTASATSAPPWILRVRGAPKCVSAPVVSLLLTCRGSGCLGAPCGPLGPRVASMGARGRIFSRSTASISILTEVDGAGRGLGFTRIPTSGHYFLLHRSQTFAPWESK